MSWKQSYVKTYPARHRGSIVTQPPCGQCDYSNTWFLILSGLDYWIGEKHILWCVTLSYVYALRDYNENKFFCHNMLYTFCYSSRTLVMFHMVYILVRTHSFLVTSCTCNMFFLCRLFVSDGLHVLLPLPGTSQAPTCWLFTGAVLKRKWQCDEF